MLRNYLLLSLIPLLLIVPGEIFAEELIPLKLEMERDHYQYGEFIKLKVIPERVIPNTDFSLILVGEDGKIRSSYELYSPYGTPEFVLLVANRYSSDNPFGILVPEIGLKSQKYTAHVFYGNCEKINCDPKNFIGYEKLSFTFLNTPPENLQFMMDNYKLNKFDLGTNVIITEPESFLDENSVNVIIGFGTDLDKVGALGDQKIKFFAFNNENEAKKAFDYSETEYMSQTLANNLKIPSNFNCKISSADYRCYDQNLIIWFYVKDPLTVASVLNKINLVGFPPSSNFSETTTTSQSSPKCGTGTILQDGICVVDKSQATESKSNGGGCLIATATFDSELAPQVQKLREIRDSKLLQTESGSQFMEHFNSFYYSFSPIIADYERENPVFKEIVKAGITPMLSTLSLMDYAETESEVLTIGISLIILNAMMYVGLPVFGIIVARKSQNILKF